MGASLSAQRSARQLYDARNIFLTLNSNNGTTDYFLSDFSITYISGYQAYCDTAGVFDEIIIWF